MSIEIIIKGDKAIGKTFIARVITRALIDKGIAVTGESNDVDIREIKQYKEYETVKIITTNGD